VSPPAAADEAASPQPGSSPAAVSLGTIAREWTRIGVTGFGGPPTHIALLRKLVVGKRGWMTDEELEAAIAACNLLPGPASTQLAIFCAQRLRGRIGALVGGLGFIMPSVIAVTALSAVFLSHSPPDWIRGAGGGAGASVAPVAVRAGLDLLIPSWGRTHGRGRARARWPIYIIAGAVGSALVGAYLVLVLLACGLIELALSRRSSTRPRGRPRGRGARGRTLALMPIPAVAPGGLGALAWVALKVGALSYGGGFVIVPLMQADAVHTYGWMSAGQFLNAVALGQITPGPVTATVASVGFAAAGVGGAALAAAIAFLPSFALVLAGAPHFERMRSDAGVQAFLAGAGPAAVGAILGTAIPLANALRETWQYELLAAAAVLLLVLRTGIVKTLVGAGIVGAVTVLAGGPVP
jgi:chromate transporter